MTLLDERQVSALNPDGVAILLVYGAKLFPPRDGKPGIRVTVDKHGTCLLEAVGYSHPDDAVRAMNDAAQTCLDADLIVSFPPPWCKASPSRARIVRRRS